MDFYPELPPLSDRERFPPSAHVRAMMQLNRDCRKHLQMGRGFECRADTLDRIEAAYVEACRAYRVWDRLDDADYWQDWACDSDPFYYHRRRREALAWLLDQLGPADYYAGRMPPAIPLARIPWR